MANLLIYDSSRWASVAAAAVTLNSVPTATLHDTKDETVSTINTYVTNLVAAAYSKIYSCIGSLRVEEVVGTAILTITGFAADEIAWCKVDEGGDDIPLGSYTSGGASVTADAVLLRDSINAGTDYHGYSAAAALGVVTISAPAGSGAAANAYEMKVDSDKTATIALTVTTDFDTTVTGVTAVGVLGDIAESDFVALEAKVTAAAEETGTATAGANITVDLAVGSSAVNNYYNRMYILTLTGTGSNQARRITGYVGSTLQATVDAAWGTNPDATTTYAISADLASYGKTYLLKGAAWTAWEDIYETVTPPLAIQHITDYTYPYYPAATYTGTAQASAAGTIVLAAGASAVDDKFNAFYVGIVSGTGAGQYRYISDYDGGTVTATISVNWTVTPSTDSVYVIMLYEDYMFRDKAVENYITAYLYDLSLAIAKTGWAKLLDLGRTNTTFTVVDADETSAPNQDLGFLTGTVIPEGLAIYYNSLR